MIFELCISVLQNFIIHSFKQITVLGSLSFTSMEDSLHDEDTVMESSPASDIVKATFRLLVPANVSDFGIFSYNLSLI